MHCVQGFALYDIWKVRILVNRGLLKTAFLGKAYRNWRKVAKNWKILFSLLFTFLNEILSIQRVLYCALNDVSKILVDRSCETLSFWDKTYGNWRKIAEILKSLFLL